MSMQAINFAMTLPVGEPGPRLLLFVIAHHVHWQTGLMYVSQSELAKEVCSSERSVRRWLDYLEDSEYITRQEKRDDRGHRLPDEIELIGYIEWQKVLYEGGTIRNPKSRGKAVQNQPDNLAGGEEPTGQMEGGLPDKTGEPTGQQVAGTNEPLRTIRRTISAGARASDASASRAPRARAALVVSRTDVQWQAWLDAVDLDTAERLERAGEFTATARWPTEGERIISIANARVDITARIIGEKADA